MNDRKKQRTAAWLAFLLGAFGVHRFYLEEHGKGLIYLFFSWTLVPLVLGVVDGVRLLSLTPGEFDRRFNDALFIAPPEAGRPIVALPAPIQVNVNTASGVDVPTQLEKLHALKERGVITAEEYEAQKARLLG